MAGRKMAVLVLSEAERSELMLLSARRKTAQALAARGRIILECARGLENREVAAHLRLAKGTAASGAAALLSTAWMDCVTFSAPVLRARSRMPIMTPSFRPWRVCRRMPRTGVRAAWPRLPESRSLLCNAFCVPSAYSRTESRRSSFRLIRTLLSKSAMLSGFTSRRPSTPSCSASMRRARFRRWTAASKCCRCGLAKLPGAAMITSVMVRLRCLPPSTSQRPRDWEVLWPRHKTFDLPEDCCLV